MMLWSLSQTTKTDVTMSKAEIARAALGSRPATEVTPQELERWLRTQRKTAATSNRYKAFISLCYREGSGRLRFLTRREYGSL
jgi:hypothetical protein